MKKLIAMLLLASLMMSMAAAACATGTVDRAAAEKEEYQNIGISFYYPDEFKTEKGMLYLSADDDMLGPGIYIAQCNYVGVTMEWYESALHAEDIKQEDIMKYMNSTAALFMILGIDQNRTAEDICAAYKALSGMDVLSPSDMTEVASFEDITWYLLEKDFTGNYQNLEPEFAAEYDSLRALVGTLVSNADYYRPVGTYDAIADQTVSFETTDLDGTYSSESVVSNGTENEANAYRIFVVDQSSRPVAGAMVQFCTADTCKIGKTDDSGMASFDDPEGVYEVHILKVPKGYKKNDSLFTTPDTYSDMVIVVETE